jgi:hypothetical protein
VLQISFRLVTVALVPWARVQAEELTGLAQVLVLAAQAQRLVVAQLMLYRLAWLLNRSALAECDRPSFSEPLRLAGLKLAG